MTENMGERIKRRKEELGMTTSALAKLSGVPVGTINKIMTGETKSPRYDTLAALEKVLFPEEQRGVSYNYNERAAKPIGCVREGNLSYTASRQDEKEIGTKKQGEYTLTDYYALPEDVRAELIDGELIFMEAPDFAHQFIISELSFLLTSYIRQKQGTCLVLTSPLDVQLDCDDRTMVQPDILVSCQRERRNTRGIYGAPDMVIEVTSPSTKKRDYSKKMVKYMEAGVREYWIVDLQKRVLITYFFEEDMIPHVYTFESEIPVRMFQAECKIDFKGIAERMQGSY